MDLFKPGLHKSQLSFHCGPRSTNQSAEYDPRSSSHGRDDRAPCTELERLTNYNRSTKARVRPGNVWLGSIPSFLVATSRPNIIIIKTKLEATTFNCQIICNQLWPLLCKKWDGYSKKDVGREQRAQLYSYSPRLFMGTSQNVHTRGR